jgi:DNA-binding transcriptional MocR family regulator
VLYLVPTLHNPTTATLGPDRRRALAEVSRRHELQIVEDDAYGLLPATAPEAVARFAPERTWYVATLAKALSPGLRVAYVAAPGSAEAETLVGALRAVTGMAAPLNVAVATAWIREGTAQDLLAGVRAEAAARSALAREILPQARGGEHGIHLWLDLPEGWDRRALAGAARGRGLALAPADAFAAGEGAPDGVRLSLGAARDRASLAEGLRAVADILRSGAGAERGHLV